MAEKNPFIIEKHGDARTDEFYWLRNREEPKVLDYLASENSYTEQVLEPTKVLQEDIYQEIIKRTKQDDASVPYFKHGYWYYVRFETGQEHPIYCRRQGDMEATEEVFLNVNEMAEGHDYYHVGGISVRPDQQTIAFGVDTVGRRIYTIYFKDLVSGVISEKTIENTSGGGTWSAEGNVFFYTLKDLETLRTYKIMRHKYGSQTAQDVLVYEEADDTFYSTIYKSKSEKYLIISSSASITTHCQLLEANDPYGEFRPFSDKVRGMEYGIEHYGNKFYVLTNWDAQNFRLMQTPESKTSRENWSEVIAHRSDVYLEGIEVFSKHLVVEERKEGLVNLRIIDQRTQEEHSVPFEEEAYMVYSSVNVDFDTELLHFGYQSMTTPPSTYEYNMRSREQKLIKRKEILGDFQPNQYETRRLYAKARDAEEIPVSLVYKKGFERNSRSPLLLYGYGSYGSTIDPYFSLARLSLLDRGFAFAIAHIRGGEVKGRPWYDNGKMMHKKNTFYDFIDAAEMLVAEKYTSADSLYAMGGSAGGLLVGAVANMRPDLFKGMVAQVPFVDVVTTMLDETIPLTTGEYDEWGNPNENDAYFYMKSYSPYDNVTAQNYPHMLVTTGLHDSQVQYWEPAKWVARLRDRKTDTNVLLLHTTMEAGHGGKSGRFEQLREVAMEYAFLIQCQQWPRD